MIHRIVQAALRQRFLVLMLTAFITVGGILSFERMPVDAYPDLSPPQVEIITQWPDHAAEEVERLVTLPLELEMNGVPHMITMRSISLYGLSDLRLTFEENTDDYLARQIVFERWAQATLPTGVVPSLAPLFSPSGLVYRYVLVSPDRTPQELKTIEEWVGERAHRSVPGGAVVGECTRDPPPRLGEFGFQKNDDSVEGVILMRRGEQTQTVLKGVEA